MQYVWQHRLYPAGALRILDGRRLVVLNPGIHNRDAGPDFFNASLRIGQEIWAGNVEIHVKASDWLRHRHQEDPAYDTVVLHVVDTPDIVIKRKDGTEIPHLRLQCRADLNTHYHSLVDYAAESLPCAPYVKNLPAIVRTDWIESLGVERLQAKADRVRSLLALKEGSWEEACYIMLARSLGFGTNSEPFERLARALPLIYILKHSDSLQAIEALLFGMAGLLPHKASEEPYTASLQEEFAFYANKFSLCPAGQLGWKMSRMRPQNFPHRRIAYLAAMLAGGFNLMSEITRVEDVEKARSLFVRDISDYWNHHYTFESQESPAIHGMGHASIDILIINCLVPMLYAFGESMADWRLTDRAIELLRTVPPEKNRPTMAFSAADLNAKDAFTSQALLQLNREYCQKQKCLFCRFGHKYLASKAVSL